MHVVHPDYFNDEGFRKFKLELISSLTFRFAPASRPGEFKPGRETVNKTPWSLSARRGTDLYEFLARAIAITWCRKKPKATSRPGDVTTSRHGPDMSESIARVYTNTSRRANRKQPADHRVVYRSVLGNPFHVDW